MSSPTVPWAKRRFTSVTSAGASNVVVPLPPRDNRDARDIATKMTLGGVRSALVASAARIGMDELRKQMKGATWQEEGWACWRQIGELHYAAEVHSNAASRLKLELVRTDPTNGGDVKLDDVPIDELSFPDLVAMSAMRDLAGDSPSGLSELMRTADLNWFIAGDCMLVGMIPRDNNDSDTLDADDSVYPAMRTNTYEGSLTNLTWRIYGTTEIRQKGSTIIVGGQEYAEDEIVTIRLWNPDPQNCLASDSGVRSLLPVLRVLIGLAMHVGATIDSRLAGAGAFILPASATALGVNAPEEDDSVNPVIESIMETMLTPIKNRDSASAVVPVFLTVPDDVAFQPQHITFSTPFDGMVHDLTDLFIRRTALGLNMPPEILLGQGDSNHWGAWAIQEDNVRTHLIPPMQRLADGIVREYLRVVMVEAGVDPSDAAAYSLVVDPHALIDRPNRHAEALALYSIGALNQGSLLDASGFRAEDSPTYGADPAVQLAFQLLLAQPVLIKDVGFDNLVQQFRLALMVGPGPVAPEPAAQNEEDAQEADPNAPGAQVPPADVSAPVTAAPGAPPVVASGAISPESNVGRLLKANGLLQDA